MNDTAREVPARPAQEQNVAELLQMLGTLQEPVVPAAAEVAPARPEKATWAFDSPVIEPGHAGQGFAVLHPACRLEIREQFRMLRARVFLERKNWFDQGADLRTIAVLSPARKDGKTFGAANLAAVLAATGDTRVLLVEANPASPVLQTRLGLPGGGGLCEALQGESWYRLLYRVPPMGLYVLPFGAHRVNQIDSFDHTALPAWLHGLRGSFDWIVFDGPSFTHVSDAELLANFADANLLVVRRADTPVAPVARAMDRIPPQSFLGAVVTPPLGER